MGRTIKGVITSLSGITPDEAMAFSRSFLEEPDEDLTLQCDEAGAFLILMHNEGRLWLQEQRLSVSVMSIARSAGLSDEVDLQAIIDQTSKPPYLTYYPVDDDLGICTATVLLDFKETPDVETLAKKLVTAVPGTDTLVDDFISELSERAFNAKDG